MNALATESARRAMAWLALGLVLATTAATYRGALDNGFVWDDGHTIVANHAIESLAFVGRWFSSADATSTLRDANYRPVLVASYAVDYAIWGRNPSGYHATNLLIHLGVVVLVFLLARRLWGGVSAALWASGIAALHPLNGEAINYLSARSSSLSAFFILAAVWVHDTRSRGGAGWGRIAAALTLGLAALGTKETAVVLPLLLIAWERARFGDTEGWRAAIARSWPWWGLVAGFLALRAAVLADAPAAPAIEAGPWQTGLFGAKILLSSIGHWFVPAGLAIDHAWPWEIGAGEGTLLMTGGIGVALATWWVFRRDRRMGWCVAWFWIALLPLIVLPTVSRLTLYQDHRVYLGGVGLAWAAGRVIALGASRLSVRRPMGIAAAILAFAVAGAVCRADAARTAVWRDADRLWDDVLATYPDSVLGWNHRGLRWLRAGETEQARLAFERSKRLAPRFPPTHNYLGIAYAGLGDRERAVAEFETAVTLNPYYTVARLNLGNAYEQQGRPDLALAAYERGLPDGPWARETLDRSARLLERQGRFGEALERYRRILIVDPTDPRVKEAMARLGRELAEDAVDVGRGR